MLAKKAGAWRRLVHALVRLTIDILLIRPGQLLRIAI